MPVGPTSLRNNDEIGAIRFNSDTTSFEGYYGLNTWASLGGVKSVDNKTYGDVDTDNLDKVINARAPYPGGVGPITVSALFLNLSNLIKFN